MINSFDSFFYHLINQTLTAGWMDFLMVKFSDKLFWIPFYAIVVWLLFRHYGKRAALILLFMALAVVASDRISSGFIKPLIKRQRPCLELSLSPRILDPCHDTGSMPSSHASNHFAVAFFMVLLIGIRNKLTTLLWLGWAAAVAYSRVYCGVHYPTDVLAGSALGILLGTLFYYLYQFTASKIKWN